MKITKWILIVLIVLFVVGCNGNPTKTGSQTSNTNSVSPTNDVSKEFSDLAASKAKATYQETYDITSTVQGQPPITVTLYALKAKVHGNAMGFRAFLKTSLTKTRRRFKLTLPNIILLLTEQWMLLVLSQNASR